jgi:hypothetical protein
VAGAGLALVTLISAGWIDASRWILSEPLFLAFTFLALWAAERGGGTLPPLRRDLEVAPYDRRAGAGGPHAGRWLLLAGAAAVLALFTRSAGLPLVLALLAVLAVARRWKELTLLGAAVAVPGAWWVFRSRFGSGVGAYESEFWMVNPYEPELGLISWLDLPARVWTNLRIYSLDVLPGQWWGSGTGGILLLGIVLGGMAVWGWSLKVRLGAGVAEIFVPLYAGLILLWPEVWSGERFLLPLIPPILLYAGHAVRYAALPLGKLGAPILVPVCALILALPAVPGWLMVGEQAAECRRLAGEGDVFRCHGPAVQEFRDASAWIGLNLPEDAVVLNRKPSIHHLLGGRPGRIFPFTHDPDRLLAEADRLGARFLLLDYIDGISPYYLPVVIQAQPLAFCWIGGWGGGEGVPGTDLWGILPPEARVEGGDVSQIAFCPPNYQVEPTLDPETRGLRIPRFADQPDREGRP